MRWRIGWTGPTGTIPSGASARSNLCWRKYMSKKAEKLVGLCAKCRGVEVQIGDDCANLARTFNHELKKRGQRILGRNEVALCPTCYRAWQAARRAEGERVEARYRRDFRLWADTAKEYGVEQADAELPDEWRKDFGFQNRREKWIAWWGTQQGKARKGGTV